MAERKRFIPYNPSLKELARSLRKQSTLGEVLLWNQIRNRQVGGYKFLRQKPIGNYIVDFFCAELMLVVEIDGGSHDGKLAEDKNRQSWLESFGVTVIRFLESDVRDNMEGVIQHLCLRIEEIEKAHPPGPLEGGIWGRTALCRSGGTDEPGANQRNSRMIKENPLMKARDVVVVDGIRTAFGRAGEKGYFWLTRADDMVVRVIRELLRRTPQVKPEMVEENVWGATTQEGDQGLTLGRTTALLAGIPDSCAGFAVDRMCAGGLTAVTAAASEIALGACDIAIAGGVEHMGHHPMGATADPNPRFLTERLVSEDALVMGKTAENLHDLFPGITREMADEYAVHSQSKTARAYADGKIQKMIVPMTVYTREGWMVADRDQQPRPETTLETLRDLKTPFRAMGRVTAGNASGLNDGASGVLLMSADKAAELGVTPRMRLVGYAYAGVRPEIMGYGPIPSTRKVLERTGLTMDDIGLVELNEAFAVQCIVFMQEFGFKFPDDERLNPLGGAVAFGHPLAGSGPRLMLHLMQMFSERPQVRHGLTALCVGLGQGASAIWENLRMNGTQTEREE